MEASFFIFAAAVGLLSAGVMVVFRDPATMRNAEFLPFYASVFVGLSGIFSYAARKFRVSGKDYLARRVGYGFVFGSLATAMLFLQSMRALTFPLFFVMLGVAVGAAYFLKAKTRA